MGLPISRPQNRLPHRFPVGATYVVEGFGGEDGVLRVVARYVVLPGGRRINVPPDAALPPASRPLPLRRRTGSKQFSKQSPAKPRLQRAGKKFAARRGTA
jgi:hypothetical protein